MDAVYYEDLAAALWRANRARGRLKGEQAQLLHRFIDAGEYGLVPEEIAGYHRIARRRGKKKAQVAVARSILVIVWHLLSNPGPGSPTSAPATTRPASISTAS